MAAIQLNHHYSHAYPLRHHKKQDPRSHKTRLRELTAQRPVKFHVKATASSPTGARQLIQSGAIKAIPAKEATEAMSSEGYILLDVRPAWEREKARVAGSLHVPLFVGDPDNSPLTLLKKWVHLGYVGLWTGQEFTMLNPDFLSEVEAAVPDREAKLLVACGEGLRSAMAASKLYEGGYKNLGWLAGGFNRSGEDDFPSVKGPEKLKYATIGGVSYYFLQLLILLQGVGKEQE